MNKKIPKTSKSKTRLDTKGTATRQQIIERAAPVLNTKGYAGTAMSDLMQATGLQKGGLYRHFNSKEQLALESLRHLLAKAEAARFAPLDPHANEIDQLLAFVDHFVHRRSPSPGGCPILNSSVEHDDANPLLRAEAARTLTHWLTRLASIVKAGITHRTITKSADPHTVSLTLFSMLEGALALQRLAPTLNALHTIHPHLQTYLHSLRP